MSAFLTKGVIFTDGVSGTLSDLVVTGTIDTTNETTTNLVTTAATSQSIVASAITAANLSTTHSSATNLQTVSATSANLLITTAATSVDLITTNLRTTDETVSNLLITAATSQSIIATNGTVSNLYSTATTVSNLLSTSSTLPTVISTLSSATNLCATSASINSLIGGIIYSSSAGYSIAGYGLPKTISSVSPNTTTNIATFSGRVLGIFVAQSLTTGLEAGATAVITWTGNVSGVAISYIQQINMTYNFSGNVTINVSHSLASPIDIYVNYFPLGLTE